MKWLKKTLQMENWMFQYLGIGLNNYILILIIIYIWFILVWVDMELWLVSWKIRTNISLWGINSNLINAMHIKYPNKKWSAFAPICSPSNCPWGQFAFTGYFGSDKSKWIVWKNLFINFIDLLFKYNNYI